MKENGTGYEGEWNWMKENGTGMHAISPHLPGRVTGTGKRLFSVRMENLSSLTGVCRGACANINSHNMSRG